MLGEERRAVMSDLTNVTPSSYWGVLNTFETLPRGVIPDPPKVLAAVAKEQERIRREHGFEITPEARQRMLMECTLEYYFGCLPGLPIVYRSAPEGVEVLAVGLQEEVAFRQGLSEDEQHQYTFRQI
jgi:hypothetical protein